ncbi:MAG TPA: zf-HC2 domain-containing protein [Methylophilaceae bacterium]|jgi:hypothetical protein
MDRPLTLRERVSVWLHLGICDPCRNFVSQLRLLRAVLKQQSHHAENDEKVVLSHSAREAIRETLHQH